MAHTRPPTTQPCSHQTANEQTFNLYTCHLTCHSAAGTTQQFGAMPGRCCFLRVTQHAGLTSLELVTVLQCWSTLTISHKHVHVLLPSLACRRLRWLTCYTVDGVGNPATGSTDTYLLTTRSDQTAPGYTLTSASAARALLGFTVFVT